MEAIKHLGNDRNWHDVYDYKLNIGDNLAGLDIDKVVSNLKLDERYIKKDVAKKGSDPSSIHHTMIQQGPTGRLTTDNQIAYWNAKLDEPMSGTVNLAGDSNTVVITHGAKNRKGKSVKPYYCTFVPNENTMGCLGEYWISWDNETMTIGNTGSYTGEVTWIAFYSRD